jgi:hypothetical protein
MKHRVKVTHKQLFYAAEDHHVFRVWEDLTKLDQFEVISAADLLIRLRVYTGAGIPCFNAASMFNPTLKIKRRECRHAV